MVAGSFIVLVVYRRMRMRMYVKKDELVGEVKERIREKLRIDPDEAPVGVEVHDKKTLSLSYAGASLNDSWVFTDLGIPAGATIKAVRREEMKPSFLIRCRYNNQLFPVYEPMNFLFVTGSILRGFVSRKVGLPVSAFRLCTSGGVEIYDCHVLDDYGLALGGTVNLEVWEGWEELVNAALTGFISHLLPLLSKDEVLAKFQMKVALYVAAHFGFVDMAVGLLRKGVRPGEAVNEHPSREWCHPKMRHADSWKAPIHEAAEFGQLEVLRAFVVENICSVYARDAENLTPLNIALRKHQKDCASFLLTKQWSKVPYNAKHSIPLSTYAHMKQWAVRSRDKTATTQIPDRHSHTKHASKRQTQPEGSLLGHGVVLDGFPPSRNQSMLTARILEERKLWKLPGTAADPETYLRNIAYGTGVLKLPRLPYREEKKGRTDKRPRKKHEEDSSVPSDTGITSRQKKFSTAMARSEMGTSGGESQLPPIFRNSRTNLPSDDPQQDADLQRMILQADNDLRSSEISKKSTSSAVEGGMDKGRLRNNNLLERSPLRRSVGSDGFAHGKRFVGYSPRPMMDCFESRLGLESRDFALRCLDLAQSFTEKRWLSRVEQAIRIASKGVQKVFDSQEHIFHTERPHDGNPQHNVPSKNITIH